MSATASTPTNLLKAPFPWFGGKSRVAYLVWDRFGDVRNYVEPFAGSLAVLLRRPTEAKIETVNDLDCWIANFWRALQHDPEGVAEYADWPVNEADLHARHLWLVKQTDFRERMKTDPDFYDVKIAGWWVWGISQWIGSGWCAAPHSNLNKKLGRADGTPQRGRPNLQQSQGVSQAVNRQSPPGDPWRKKPNIGDGGRGVLVTPGRGADLSGDAGASGRAIHASGLNAKGGLYEWMLALADRLRRVRVCCGDWTRIVGPAPTTCIGTTAVFLDPPYAVDDRSDVYGEESRDIANDVRKWAIANGDNPELRISLCGYDGEHEMPDTWSVVQWKANGGFSNQKRGGTQGKQNAVRERIWFSPHCLRPQDSLFWRDGGTS